MIKKKKNCEYYQIYYAAKEFVLILSLDHLLAPQCNNVLASLDFQSSKTKFA